jgi:hypothetical protein
MQIMIKRDEISSPDSCLNKAADDEPIFVLRANDELSANLVRRWALEYAAQKNRQTGDINPKQMAKINEAYALAHAMDEWPRKRL